MKRSFIIFLIILGSLAGGFAITRFFFVPFTVKSTSMEPNVAKGMFCIFLKAGKPQKGDIVLAENPGMKGTYLVKRVIAVEDDFIEIKKGKISINNRTFEPRWKTVQKTTLELPAHFSKKDNMLRLRIKRNFFFLLNDTIDKSYDSREFGPVHKKNIVGKLIFAK